MEFWVNDALCTSDAGAWDGEWVAEDVGAATIRWLSVDGHWTDALHEAARVSDGAHLMALRNVGIDRLGLAPLTDLYEMRHGGITERPKILIELGHDASGVMPRIEIIHPDGRVTMLDLLIADSDLDVAVSDFDTQGRVIESRLTS